VETLNRILWYAKQLLPFTYWTEYFDLQESQYKVSVWKMWFGRCFNVREWVTTTPGAKLKAVVESA